MNTLPIVRNLYYLFFTILVVSEAITNSSLVVTTIAVTFESGLEITASLPRKPNTSGK